MSRTLGLDIGSNSVGWSLVDEAAGQLIGIGVRVFPEGVDRDTSGAEHPKNEQRRMARGHRRQIARRARRKAALRRALVEAGWWSDSPDLVAADPYALRAKGLNEPITLPEFGRVLMHLNQRADSSRTARPTAAAAKRTPKHSRRSAPSPTPSINQARAHSASTCINSASHPPVPPSSAFATGTRTAACSRPSLSSCGKRSADIIPTSSPTISNTAGRANRPTPANPASSSAANRTHSCRSTASTGSCSSSAPFTGRSRSSAAATLPARNAVNAPTAPPSASGCSTKSTTCVSFRRKGSRAN